jgi:hypothetical protein
MKLPTLVDIPGKRPALPLTDSQRTTLLKCFKACACFDYTALGIAAASSREAPEEIQASPIQIWNRHAANRCYIAPVHTVATPDVPAQNSNNFVKQQH